MLSTVGEMKSGAENGCSSCQACQALYKWREFLVTSLVAPSSPSLSTATKKGFPGTTGYFRIGRTLATQRIPSPHQWRTGQTSASIHWQSRTCDPRCMSDFQSISFSKCTCTNRSAGKKQFLERGGHSRTCFWNLRMQPRGVVLHVDHEPQISDRSPFVPKLLSTFITRRKAPVFSKQEPLSALITT
jgi:hypothetical protein